MTKKEEIELLKNISFTIASGRAEADRVARDNPFISNMLYDRTLAAVAAIVLDLRQSIAERYEQTAQRGPCEDVSGPSEP